MRYSCFLKRAFCWVGMPLLICVRFAIMPVVLNLYKLNRQVCFYWSQLNVFQTHQPLTDSSQNHNVCRCMKNQNLSRFSDLVDR